MADLAPEQSGSFPQLLGHLIHLLRNLPGETAAVEQTLSLLSARVAHDPALIEAGIENSWALDGDPLKERLQVRQVDAIRVDAGTSGPEILELARTLAHNTAPIASTAMVRVKLLPDPLPLEFSGPRSSVPDPAAPASVPRARTGDNLATMVEGILRELDKAIGQQQWLGALHDAQAAVRLLPGMQEDTRRMFSIALKRLLTRQVIMALIEQGYRIAEEQGRTVEVVRAGGYPAAELMMEILRQSDTIGPRAFLMEAVGGMPEALPLIVPMLKSNRSADAWLAAEVLGRMRVPDAVPALVAQVNHPDERVRHAVIESLGQYRDKRAVEPLRQALTHTLPATRARAARALAARGSGAIAMPLFAALESEKDPEAWLDLLRVVARLESVEAALGLARLALQRRGFLRFGSSDLKRRLAVVQALAESGTLASRQGLTMIAAEAEGEVQQAAITAGTTMKSGK